jgi:hypothetical protein
MKAEGEPSRLLARGIDPPDQPIDDRRGENDRKPQGCEKCPLRSEGAEARRAEGNPDTTVRRKT